MNLKETLKFARAKERTQNILVIFIYFLSLGNWATVIPQNTKKEA